RREVEQRHAEEVAPPGPQADRDRAAGNPAQPDQAGAGEEAAEQVAMSAVPVLDDVVEPRPDEPADERGEDDLVRPVGRLAELAEPPHGHGAAGDEAEREADSEALEGERADVDLGVHGT